MACLVPKSSLSQAPVLHFLLCAGPRAPCTARRPLFNKHQGVASSVPTVVAEGLPLCVRSWDLHTGNTQRLKERVVQVQMRPSDERPRHLRCSLQGVDGGDPWRRRPWRAGQGGPVREAEGSGFWREGEVIVSFKSLNLYMSP